MPARGFAIACRELLTTLLFFSGLGEQPPLLGEGGHAGLRWAFVPVNGRDSRHAVQMAQAGRLDEASTLEVSGTVLKIDCVTQGLRHRELARS